MTQNKSLSFIFFLIITFFASLISSIIIFNFKEPWYSSLAKPPFNPPEMIFAPVWTTLYLMMSIAIWLFYHSKNSEKKTTYIYYIHLLINTTWAIVFFGFHNIIAAVIILIILIGMIINLILRFRRVNLVSSYLMIPYLLWCSFALFLNINLVMIN